MKNNFRILLSILVLLLIVGPMVEDLKAQDRKIYLDFNVHIEFGRKSKGCTGFGLCIFITDISVGGDISARYLPKKNLLHIEFPTALVKQHPDQFENDLFTMEEDLIVSDETSRDLGSDVSLIIPKGTYEIERTESSFVIQIPQK